MNAIVTPAARTIALPPLNHGEKYAGGIVLLDGSVRHTILLPVPMTVLNWKAGNAWAAEQGGVLPYRIEQSLLLLHLPDEFEPRAYWSCEQSASNGAWAWYQYFGSGDQGNRDKSLQLACRAVRREII